MYLIDWSSIEIYCSDSRAPSRRTLAPNYRVQCESPLTCNSSLCSLFNQPNYTKFSFKFPCKAAVHLTKSLSAFFSVILDHNWRWCIFICWLLVLPDGIKATAKHLTQCRQPSDGGFEHGSVGVLFVKLSSFWSTAQRCKLGSGSD